MLEGTQQLWSYNPIQIPGNDRPMVHPYGAQLYPIPTVVPWLRSASHTGSNRYTKAPQMGDPFICGQTPGHLDHKHNQLINLIMQDIDPAYIYIGCIYMWPKSNNLIVQTIKSFDFVV